MLLYTHLSANYLRISFTRHLVSLTATNSSSKTSSREWQTAFGCNAIEMHHYVECNATQRNDTTRWAMSRTSRPNASLYSLRFHHLVQAMHMFPSLNPSLSHGVFVNPYILATSGVVCLCCTALSVKETRAHPHWKDGWTSKDRGSVRRYSARKYRLLLKTTSSLSTSLETII